MELRSPVTSAYSVHKLRNFLEAWREAEESETVADGYDTCTPFARGAVSTRQWDTEDDVLDDELERGAAQLLAQCVETLEPVERALILHALGVRSRWVLHMEPARAQARYEAAMLKLAMLARRAGVEV